MKDSKEQIEDKLRAALNIGNALITQIELKRKSISSYEVASLNYKGELMEATKELRKEMKNKVTKMSEISRLVAKKKEILRTAEINNKSIKDAKWALKCLESEKTQLDQQIQTLVTKLGNYGKVTEIWKYQ